MKMVQNEDFLLSPTTIVPLSHFVVDLLNGQQVVDPNDHVIMEPHICIHFNPVNAKMQFSACQYCTV